MYNKMIPILETKLSDSDEDYFENTHKVWAKMDKKKKTYRDDSSVS